MSKLNNFKVNMNIISILPYTVLNANLKIYSSVLNTSQVGTIWNFDPNYSLPNVTQVSLPKMFQIVVTWLACST